MTPSLPDPRNADIQIWVGDGLYPREDAKVSVFDSSVQGGDAVWEGLRVYDGQVFMLDEHLDRLFRSAKIMAFAEVPTREFVEQAIFETLAANGMRDQAHMRLTLSRGKKVTSGMSPTNNQYGPCLIVLAEWKLPVYDSSGIRLITSSWRRNAAQCIDSKIHHNNLINNILAKIESDLAGVDDAVMLDVHGFVSETNATNMFAVCGQTVLTPHPDACLPGITRALVIELCKREGIELVERNVSVAEFYVADEVFTTGTMGELSPVLEIDGRKIGSGSGANPMTQRIQALHTAETKVRGTRLPA